MRITRLGRLAALGALSVVLAVARPLAAHEASAAARVQAEAAIQRAQEARDAVLKARETAVAPVGRHPEREAEHQRWLLDVAARELEHAAERLAAGDAEHAQHHAKLASRLIEGASRMRTESGGR